MFSYNLADTLRINHLKFIIKALSWFIYFRPFQNYSDANSNYAVVNKIKTNQQQPNSYGDENPYDYVAPRSAYQQRQGPPVQTQSHYSRPPQGPDSPGQDSAYNRHGQPHPGHESAYGRQGPPPSGVTRSFGNQIYMDTHELQKLKAAQEQPRAGHHGNHDNYATRDSGFTSPADRPR